MREIFYNSVISDKTIDEIKLLTLYYDKVNVVNDSIYTIGFDKVSGEPIVIDLPFLPENFNIEYGLLIDEGILSTTKRDETIKNDIFAQDISKLVNSKEDYIFPFINSNKDTREITSEVFTILKSLLKYKPGEKINKEFIWWYYAFKLNWSIKLLLEGKNCINGNNNLNYLFEHLRNDIFIKNISIGKQSYTKSFAIDAIKLKLPNPSLMSFEDILELKLKLKDQLEEFSFTINTIELKCKTLFGSDYITELEYKNIFYNEIKKPINELELKIKNLKSKTFREFVSNLKNPKSYSPLIGTVYASLPLKYTLLTSFGLIALQTYQQYREEHREIENNGLYFLLQL